MYRSFSFLFAVSALSAARIAAQDLPAPRVDYALTDVRIVTAPGRVIDRGTVLVRNGRIAAVGAQVTVPAGVMSMSLSGHTVFPGLIDAATTIGVPSTSRPPSGGPAAAAEAAAGRGGRGGGGAAPGGGGRGGAGGGGGGSTPAPLVLPELDAAADAAHMFAPTPDQLSALRAGGVTTVGLLFDGGLFPGRVGAALTGGYNEAQLELRAGIGQQVSFGTRRGGYPGTLIGALPFVRQSFLDAQHELAVDKAFKAGTSAERPSYDPLSRALMPAVANEMPVWMMASTEREIERVTDIAKEIGLRNYIVVGAREGWRAIPRLKMSGAPVVVSVNWPSANSVTGRAFEVTVPSPSGTPDAASRVDAEITRAVRANAVELAKAGITVVLASVNGQSGATFRDQVRSTVEAGMSADDALRATTVSPAALLGISSAVGTIEAGKLANLVVVQGNDLFSANTVIKHVFVEGRLYEQGPTTPSRGTTGGRGGGGGNRSQRVVTGESLKAVPAQSRGY
jgi:imidazolonepropionase-like amidohydrolase